MAKTLQASKTLAGSCGTASALAYHISGNEVSGTTSTFKELAAGFLPTSPTTIYTPASSAIVSEIVVVNTTGTPVSGTALFQGGLLAVNQILGSLTIPANGTLTINGEGVQVVDGNGAQQVTFGTLTFVGDVTGSGASPVTLTLATVNGAPGTFGSASTSLSATVNGKGLVTALASQAIQIAESQVTSLVSDLALKAPIASPALTGIPTAPTAAQGTNTTQIATTAMVQSEVSVLNTTISNAIAGLDDLGLCNFATSAALPSCTYANGTSGVGATLTATAPGVLLIDTTGVPIAGSSILVQNQGSTFQNGVYTLTTVGTAIVAFVLTRRSDFDQGIEMQTPKMIPVNAEGLTAGTSNDNKTFLSTTSSPFTVGTTGITFVLLGSTYTADGATLQLSGTVFSEKDGGTTNVKLANMAQATFKMRAAGAGTGPPIDGTATQAKAALAIANTDVSGLGTLSTQNGTFSGTSSGTNTGDQTTSNSDGTIGVTTGTTNPVLTRPHITGDIDIPAGSNVSTLATVNSNVGAFGDASHVAAFTINGKGLTTSAANVLITPAAIGAASSSRLISTTLPLTGGGDLTADRTLAINPATATTAGSESASDFNRDRKEWDVYADFGIIGNLRTAAEITTVGTQVVMTSGSNIVNIPNSGATTPFAVGRDEGKRITVEGAGTSGAVLDGFIGVVNSTTQCTVLATVGGSALNASTTVTASTSVAVFVQWGTDNSSAITAMVTTINNQTYPCPKIVWGKTGLSDWTDAFGFKNPVVFNKPVWWEGIGGSHTADVGDYTKLGGTRWAWWGTSSDGGAAFGAMVTVTPPASGAATPSFVRSTSTATVANSANAVGNLAVAPANGNMLIAEVSGGAAGLTVTPPSGWNLLSGPVAGGGTTYTTWLYWKVAASEPTSWTWVLSSSVANVVSVGEYTGVATATPTFAAATAAATTTINTPTVTTPANNSIVIQGVTMCAGFSGSVFTLAAPANVTQDSQAGTNVVANPSITSQLSHDTVLQAAAGTSTARTFTASGSATNLEAWTIAMAPAAAGAAVPAIKRPQFSHGWFDGRNGDQNQALYLLKLASCQGAMLNGGLFFMDALAQGLWCDISTTPTEAKDTTRFRFAELCFRQLDNSLVAPPTTTPTTLTAVASGGVLPTSVGIVLTLTSVTGFAAGGGYAWCETIIGQPVLVKYTAVSGSTLTGCIVSTEDVVNVPTAFVNGFIVPATPGNGGAIKLGGGSGANTCCGTIADIQVSYGLTWGPAAVEFSNSDSIIGQTWMMNGGSNVTEANGNRQRKPGVRFNGSNVSQTLASRNNVLRDVDPGGSPGGPLGGISFMGALNTGLMMAFPSGPNYVDMMQMGNGSPVPTVELGAFYDWTGNGLWRPGPASQTGSVAAQALTAAVGNIVSGTILNVPPQGWQIGTRLAWDIPIHKTAAGGGLSWSVGIRQSSALTVGSGTLIATCTYTSTNAADGGALHLELVCVGPLGASCAALGQFVLTHDLTITGFSTGVTAPVADATAVTGTVRTRPTMAPFNSAAAAAGPTFLFVEINPITAATVMTVDPPVGSMCIKAANP